MLTFISSVIAFSILILIHEGGHFIAAKSVGIKVNEFSLGMGPKLWGKQKGETMYSLRAIPIGGYIKPEGEDAVSEDPRAFGNKPLWARAAVVAAGPLANFILAFAIIIVLFTLAGVPVVTVGQTTDNMPAKGLLQPGDIITKANNKPIYVFDEIIETVNNAKGGLVAFTVIRDGKENIIQVPTVYSNELGRFVVGLRPLAKLTVFKSTFGENFKSSLGYSGSLSRQLVYGLQRLFSGQMTKDEMAGPVRIVSITGEVAKLGVYSFIHFVAILSVSIGLFNLFPIPALDGGRLFFMAIEGVRGKPINQEKEATVHFIGFVLLLALMLLITFNDIKLVLGLS